MAHSSKRKVPQLFRQQLYRLKLPVFGWGSLLILRLLCASRIPLNFPMHIKFRLTLSKLYHIHCTESAPGLLDVLYLRLWFEYLFLKGLCVKGLCPSRGLTERW